MRWAAAEKLGYYPTPDGVVDLIARWLTVPNGHYRMLDPCCGEGGALARLAAALGGIAETWGVEISPGRAEEARKKLNQVLQGDWYSAHVSDLSVSLLLLNPPYDYDPEQQRVETSFLRSTLDVLMPGGILVFIVPQRLLGNEKAASVLLGYFDDLVIRRFPDEEYDKFQQVVIFGVRRAKYRKPTADDVEAFRCLARDTLPVLDDSPTPPWPREIPPVSGKARFYLAEVSNYQAICAANAMGWPSELVVPPTSFADLQPVMPLRKGHVAMLMSSGLLGTLRVEKDGRAILIKGRVTKGYTEQTEKDDKGHEVTIRRDKYTTTVGVADQDGARAIKDVDGVAKLIEEYGEEIARAILANHPLYSLDPSPQEWGLVMSLGKNRKPLPRQKEPGLLTVQAHAAIAMARCCRKHGSVLVQGQPSTGKTTISLAAMELLGAYPVLVLCPPHLVEKWIRETGEVIPGAVAVELRTLGDVQKFVRDYRSGRIGKKAIAVIASTTAKLGSGWSGAAMRRYCLPEDKNQRWEWVKALAQYKAERERLLEMKKAGLDTNEHQVPVERARKTVLQQLAVKPICPNCGSQVVDKDGDPVTDFKALDRRPHFCSECGAALFDFGRGRYRRWPLAEFIALKYPDFFQVLVADEVHEYRAKDSDRGLAFHKLCRCTRYQIALTGTFFAGKSTSIFWLLHRLRMGNTHRDFGYNEEREWVRRYGVMETRIYGKRQEDDYGVFNATQRNRISVSEEPGVSPAVLERILPQAIFISLSDLGVVLPSYREDIAMVDLTPAGQRQYDDMDETLRQMAIQDHRLMSLWIQWALNRPNSMFREEFVVKEFRNEDDEVVERATLMRLLPVLNGNGMLPKEEWLADYAAAEVKAGRRVIVYCRQTGTRDIQARLKEVLGRRGLKVGILYSNTVDSRKREAWLHRQSFDVLITNPEIVATGLDLIEFATAIYYEIEYDLTIVQQAMSRVFRITQEQPVKIVFATYTKAMERVGWGKVGTKAKHSRLLYGEAVEGAFVPQDESDFYRELARDVLEGKRIPDLETLFGEFYAETNSALGSLVAPSRPLVTPRVETVDAERLVPVAVSVRRHRRGAPPPGQLLLPGFAM